MAENQQLPEPFNVHAWLVEPSGVGAGITHTQQQKLDVLEAEWDWREQGGSSRATIKVSGDLSDPNTYITESWEIVLDVRLEKEVAYTRWYRGVILDIKSKALGGKTVSTIYCGGYWDTQATKQWVDNDYTAGTQDIQAITKDLVDVQGVDSNTRIVYDATLVAASTYTPTTFDAVGSASRVIRTLSEVQGSRTYNVDPTNRKFQLLATSTTVAERNIYIVGHNVHEVDFGNSHTRGVNNFQMIGRNNAGGVNTIERGNAADITSYGKKTRIALLPYLSSTADLQRWADNKITDFKVAQQYGIFMIPDVQGRVESVTASTGNIRLYHKKTDGTTEFVNLPLQKVRYKFGLACEADYEVPDCTPEEIRPKGRTIQAMVWIGNPPPDLPEWNEILELEKERIIIWTGQGRGPDPQAGSPNTTLPPTDRTFDGQMTSDTTNNDIYMYDSAASNWKRMGGQNIAFLDEAQTFTENISMAALKTVDGRDVSVDGTKLDGIESGATADQTSAEILAALITVDGAGSALDADLLDGISSAAFAQLASANVFTALQKISMATPILKLNDTASTIDNRMWHVRANADGFQMLTANDAENSVTIFLAVERTGVIVDDVQIRTDGVLRLFSAGAEAMRVTGAQDIGIISGKKLNLDGVIATGDTYLVEFSPDVMRIVEGNRIHTLPATAGALVGAATINTFTANQKIEKSDPTFSIKNTDATATEWHLAVGDDLSTPPRAWMLVETGVGTAVAVDRGASPIRFAAAGLMIGSISVTPAAEIHLYTEAPQIRFQSPTAVFDTYDIRAVASLEIYNVTDARVDLRVTDAGSVTIGNVGVANQLIVVPATGITVAGTSDLTGDIVTRGSSGGHKMAAFFFYGTVVANINNIAIFDDSGISGFVVMPTAGSVIGIAVGITGDITAGTLVAEVTIGGVLTGLSATLDTIDNFKAATPQAKDLDIFAAGNYIGVNITTSATYANATGDDIRVTVLYEG